MEVAQQPADCGCSKKKDRYLSFEGIDCAGNARRVFEMIEANIPSEGPEKAFWEYFMARRTPASGPVPDELFLVHSYINQIRELFEASGDEAAQALLTLLEEECC